MKEQVAVYEEKSRKRTETTDNAQNFIGFIKKYTELKQLNVKIQNELIEKIVVWDKVIDDDGEKKQKVEIYYKFVGILQG